MEKTVCAVAGRIRACSLQPERARLITDGDLTVAESGAILEYLIERYAKGRRVHTMPGYQRALEKGGPFALLR